MTRTLLVLAALCSTSAAAQQVTDGALEAGDDTQPDGEYVDAYTVDLEVGDRLSVQMTSDVFDTYLIVVPPHLYTSENDNCTPGDETTSCVDLVVEEGEEGTYTIQASSWQPGATGRYQLVIEVE